MTNRNHTQYKSQITRLSAAAASALLSRGVAEETVDFNAPPTRGRRPGDARSEFLANRAMGDWAEGIVHQELNRVLQGYRSVKYGNADNIVAGDPQFPAFYDAYQDELSTTGKRPDLLIMNNELVDKAWQNDISGLPRPELVEITPNANVGIEVRSSKFYALRYAQARIDEADQNPRFAGRKVQSFTPKLEDLRLVKRWIDSFGVPHFYVQVFFDVIYAISFHEILRILAQEPDSFEIEKNRNNQEKPTIHIPVTKGQELARFTDEPKFKAHTRITRHFRLDAYVVPTGGLARMSPSEVNQIFGL